jgi:hypothetical protein
VSVSLDNTGGRFLMRISDNGKGFDPGPDRKGNGLGNMRMRAEKMGGQLSIASYQNDAPETLTAAKAPRLPGEDPGPTGHTTEQPGETSRSGTTIELTMKPL